ncbi:MAG TPA: hypothetical protein VHZ33_15130 [Trebonia sp.]|jgi:hypothetical protein|nr:hypothetical protein [Trebonia sp.]
MAHVVTGVLRRGGQAVRSLGPATVAVTLALIIGAAGFADAATGGSFLLGRTNTENATSALKDTTGVPLSLVAPSGKPPLRVNSSTQVNRLNAQYLGGHSAKALQATGGAGLTAPAVDIPLPTNTTTEVATTGALAAGTYYVSATAMIYAGGTSPVYCRVNGAPTNWGGGSGTNYIQAAETTDVTVGAGTALSEVCYAYGTNQKAYDAAIIAIRINASSLGTEPTALPHHIVPVIRKGPLIGRPPRS